MQAAPAVQVNVQRFGHWNGFLAAISIAAMAACGAWFAARGDDVPAWSGGCVAAALLVALFGIGLSIRRHPVGLRWDSQRWYLTEPGLRAGDIGPAQVQVVLDAGAWMLLKFVPDARSTLLSVRWLPLQRRGLEVQWHALRCAVYSPRAEAATSTGLRPDPH